MVKVPWLQIQAGLNVAGFFLAKRFVRAGQTVCPTFELSSAVLDKLLWAQAKRYDVAASAARKIFEHGGMLCRWALWSSKALESIAPFLYE